jgi:hypothetical protein
LKAPANCRLIGRWRIVESDLWDRAHLDLSGSCHENLALAKRKSEGLGSSSGRSRCPPVLQRFPSEDAERFAGNKIALNAEGIVDGGLNGQEALR